MPEITYKGFADERSFTKKDFDSHGVDADSVKFNADNNFTAEVSDEVVDFLASQGEPFVDSDGKKIARTAKAAETEGETPAGTGSPEATTTTAKATKSTGRGSSTSGTPA